MRNLIHLVSALLLAACSSTPPASEPTGAPPGAQLQGAGQGPDAAPCNFKVGEACFADAESACSSAGCAMDVCLQKETHPVQVSCAAR